MSVAPRLVWLALLTSWALLADAAHGQEPSPWVDGPEPAHDEDDKPASYPPREPGAPQQDLVTPPVPRDPWVPVLGALPAPARDLRFSTTLSRTQLEQAGDVALVDGLRLVPGLYLPRETARGELAEVRGLSPTHTQIRVDGVPVLPASAWPGFALLGTFDTTSLERVTFRHGARLSGAGGASGAGGVLEIETRPAPVDWGRGVPLTGRLRGALGGPDVEKALYGVGSTGYGGVRVTASAGGFDHDSPALGRDAGLLQRMEGTGGHVGVGVDVDITPGLRAFSAWRSVRHKGNTFPDLCEEPGEGGRLDCTFIEDRAFDLLYAGLDNRAHFPGLDVASRVRAHVQHHGEFQQHSGGAVVFTERTFDDHWRGGGLADVRLVLPAPLDIGGYALRTEASAGTEILKDRVESRYTVASRRNVDAIPGGQAIERPALARRTDGATSTTASLYANTLLSIWRFALSTGVRVDGTSLFSPALEDRVPSPFLLDDGLAVSAELALRAQLTDGLALFTAVTRNQRSARLFARTLGPERFSATAPLPALPLSDRFVDHASELGLAWELPWFSVEGVGFAGLRSGPLVVGQDPIEALTGAAPSRLVRARDRRYAGVEGRAELRARSYGVSLLATVGGFALDDGTLLSVGSPVAGVPGPAGLFHLSWRPPAWPFAVWSRMRYALPQSRLAPAEAADADLCPEAAQEQPCFGAPGFAAFDLGATVAPSDRLELGVLVENLLDAPHQMHGYPLAGQGLGARFTVTLAL